MDKLKGLWKNMASAHFWLFHKIKELDKIHQD